MGTSRRGGVPTELPTPGAVPVGQLGLDHGDHVAEAVWQLFADAAQRFPDAPALIEWDSNIPTFSVLAAEARLADERRSAATLGVAYDAQVA